MGLFHHQYWSPLKIELALVEKIKALKQEGLSNRTIGKDLKISHSTVGLYVR